MGESGPHKLISVFRPAFKEASEIKFIEIDSLSHLSILIRKNVRLDETEDSFFYKVVVLDENQTGHSEQSIDVF